MKLEAFTVEGSIDSLKVNEIVAFTPTLLPFSSGVVETISGGVMSGAAPVVKIKVKSAAIKFPAESLTLVINKVCRVEGENGADGLKTAFCPSMLIVPFIIFP